MSDIDTTNRFMVAAQGEKVLIMMPPRGPISHDDALLLAAYLVAMCDREDRFSKVLAAVESC